MKVLLIDENSDDLREVRETLIRASRGSCRVETSHDLASVFVMLRRRDIDVILMDLAPKGGMQRLRAVRLGVPTIPLVVMTGVESDPQDVEVLREGADDCVEKTEISGRSLLRTLAGVIERRRRELEPSRD